MFLEVEGGEWVNLTLMSRIEFDHKRKLVSFWNAGVFEKESAMAYLFLNDPANRANLMFPGSVKA